jgi:hypothetical protein
VGSGHPCVPRDGGVDAGQGPARWAGMPYLTDFQLEVTRLFFSLPASKGFLLAGDLVVEHEAHVFVDKRGPAAVLADGHAFAEKLIHGTLPRNRT